MSESSPPAPERGSASPERELRRWHSLFEFAAEPLFLLNQHRRVLGINQACEACLGFDSKVARGLSCNARSSKNGPANWSIFAAALRPPPEVLQASPAHVRRPVSRSGRAREWWDIDFFPLRDRKGRLRILGKIARVQVERHSDTAPLPETLLTLRERLDREFAMKKLASTVPDVRRVANQVRLATQCRMPVLLIGEIGAGKQWLARTIHQHGVSRERYFATVDCASFDAAILGEMLFGECGLLATPSIGTLFLRDIDKLARELQDRLNDWLEGTGDALPRLIASSNSDSVELVPSGQLLESLRCTLSTLTIWVPPLRQRRADLPMFAESFLERARVEAGLRPTILTAAAHEVLQSYGWPGNLRELFGVLQRAQEKATGERLDVPELPLSLRLASGLERIAAPPARPISLDVVLEQVERRLIAVALRRAGGNKSRAAEYLSIWRARLLRRMEALGLNGPESSTHSQGGA